VSPLARRALGAGGATALVFTIAALDGRPWERALISGVISGVVVGVVVLLVSPFFDIPAGRDVEETRTNPKNQGP